MIKVSIRLPEELKHEVDGYAAANNMSNTDAINTLLKSGLAVEQNDIYELPVARLVSDTMRNELGLFHSEREDMLEDEQRMIAIALEEMEAQTQATLMATLTMLQQNGHIAGDPNDLYNAYIAAGRQATAGASYTDALSRGSMAAQKKVEEEADEEGEW